MLLNRCTECTGFVTLPPPMSLNQITPFNVSIIYRDNIPNISNFLSPPSSRPFKTRVFSVSSVCSLLVYPYAYVGSPSTLRECPLLPLFPHLSCSLTLNRQTICCLFSVYVDTFPPSTTSTTFPFPVLLFYL